MRAVMKRLCAYSLVFVLAMSGTATAQLSKSTARAKAEITAVEFMQRKTWGSGEQVGACRRRSPARVLCRAKVTGGELLGCSEEPPYDCTYVWHSCKFTVAVHQAGYSALGRVQGVRCMATSHAG